MTAIHDTPGQYAARPGIEQFSPYDYHYIPVVNGTSANSRQLAARFTSGLRAAKVSFSTFSTVAGGYPENRDRLGEIIQTHENPLLVLCTGDGTTQQLVGGLYSDHTEAMPNGSAHKHSLPLVWILDGGQASDIANTTGMSKLSRYGNLQRLSRGTSIGNIYPIRVVHNSSHTPKSQSVHSIIGYLSIGVTAKAADDINRLPSKGNFLMMAAASLKAARDAEQVHATARINTQTILQPGKLCHSIIVSAIPHMAAVGRLDVDPHARQAFFATTNIRNIGRFGAAVVGALTGHLPGTHLGPNDQLDIELQKRAIAEMAGETFWLEAGDTLNITVPGPGLSVVHRN